MNLKIQTFRFVLIALIVSALLVGRALAVELSNADAKGIQEVVESHFNALENDDAVSAFSFATPEVQTRIGNHDDFMDLIKERYPPIYSHRLAVFSAPFVVHDAVFQIVRVVDHNSHVWLAIFLMQKESDTDWKINNCHLVETASISI